MRKLFCAILFLSAFYVHAASKPSKSPIEQKDYSTIKSIKVTGNLRTDTSTILSHLSVKEGESYSQSKSDESIKDLYETEFFSNVQITFSDNVLHVKVEENPIINAITFEGASSVKEDVLRGEMALSPRAVFSKSKLQRDINRFMDIYSKSGRFATTIKPKMEYLSQNRVNILFVMRETEKAEISNIIFVGNKYFSNDILKSTIASKENKIYNILRFTHYDPDLIEYDKFLLTQFYRNLGYPNFRVLSATASLDPKSNSFYITFSIEEGEKFNFGKVSINNQITNISTGIIRELIDFKEGDVFSGKEVEHSTNEIITYLANKGFPFVKVNPDYDIDNSRKVVNIKYGIEKSAKIYIGKIRISGNLKTYDYVIRRELRLSEGDPYNSFLVNRSEQRIRNLNFFENVKFDVEKTASSDIVNININVEEKSTASAKFSAGYSTAAGILGNINFTEINFLGKGQTLSFDFQKTLDTFALGAGFADRNIFGSDLDGGINFNAHTENNKSKDPFRSPTSIPYNSEHYSASTFINYDITEHLNHSVTYLIQADTIKDVSDTAPLIIKEQAGFNMVSSIGHKLVYDRLDSRVKPTNGYITTLHQTFAGLGGDSKYVRNILDIKRFFPLTENIVFSISGELGHIKSLGEKPVRINENFYLGGNSFRGFQQGGLGPRDKATKNSLGGTFYYKGKAEFLFPIPGVPKDLDLSAAAFTDFGNLMNIDIAKSSGYNSGDYYNSSLMRASVGLGIIWITSIAPIRIDIGKAIIKESFDKEQLVTFSMAASL